MGTNSRILHQRMPSKDKILAYWQENSAKLGDIKGGDFGVEDPECFACGISGSATQRAHILPVVRGGDHSLENLHLLCPGCHVESEGIGCYWEWLKYKRKNEWSWFSDFVDRRLGFIGSSMKKECEHLSSINATQAQLQEHVKKLAKKIF